MSAFIRRLWNGPCAATGDASDLRRVARSFPREPRWLAGGVTEGPSDDPNTFTSSTFIAGIVVGMMVIPICCSLSREVFSQAPRTEREAAYALGATRWGMIRTVVLPFGRGGVIGATMLSLGRALGETIAVALIISPSFSPTMWVLQGGGNSVSAHIALRFQEASEFELSALMAAGLVLFGMTLVVNFLSAIVVNRSRSGAATEAFRPGGVSADDVAAAAGAAAASLALVWILYTRLLPFTGLLGFVICWYGAFLVLYAMITVHQYGRKSVPDRLAGVLAHSAGALVVGTLAIVLGYIVFRGVQAIRWNFFTENMSETGPLDPLTKGGALYAVVGSLVQLGLAVALSVPLGIATALFLVEVKGRGARVVRLLVDTMSALPSVVAGLFILATVILTLGFDKSGFAASLAITVMMLPIVIRAAEVVLRLVPGGLREAAYALGATQWQVVRRVVLPTARSGLATGVVLAMARGVGETAPVLLTAGFTREMKFDPSEGPMINLPLYIWNYVRFPQPNMVARAFAAAFTLAVLVVVLFTIARMLGGAAPGELTRRQRRKLAKETAEQRAISQRAETRTAARARSVDKAAEAEAAVAALQSLAGPESSESPSVSLSKEP